MAVITTTRWQSVRGLKELKGQLADFEAGMQLRMLASSARKAFEPVIAAAIDKAPRDTGALKSSIKVRVLKPKSGDTVVQVGLQIRRTPGGIRQDASWRWHFVEFGTVHKAARPFIRPAFDENAAQVLELLRVELSARIEKAIRRKARAAARAQK